MRAEGSIARQAAERVARLRFSADGQTLAAQSAGKVLELFRCGGLFWHPSSVFLPPAGSNQVLKDPLLYNRCGRKRTEKKAQETSCSCWQRAVLKASMLLQCAALPQTK